MTDVTRIITLGIGPASDIAGLVLTGLNPQIYVIVPGCAATSVSQVQIGTVTVTLIHAATVSDALAYTATATIEACNWTYTYEATGVLSAWIVSGVLEATYEAATGKTAISSFGCYAMAIIGSTVYFGLGDFPGGTDGGLVVSTTDGIVFVVEKVLDEQGVHDMSVHSGVLWIPGTDPTDDWTYGNVYDLTSGTWTKTRTLTNVIHCLGLWHDGTHLHVGTGSHTGDNATWLGQTFRSADNGATWDAAVTVNNYRIYDVIGFGARLYATGYLANLTKTLYYSDDDGSTWNLVAGVTPATNPRMALWGNYLIGVTSTGGLFRIDGSFNLTVLTPSITIDSTNWNVLASDASYVYAIRSGGDVYMSSDLSIWTLYSTISAPIAIYVSGGYLWISAGGTIYRTEV